jgi:flagellar biosynthesis chaperone FliJ
MSFRILMLSLSAIPLLWSQQQQPFEPIAPPPPADSGQAAAGPKDEVVDPFEGLGIMADNAEKEWERIAAEEAPKIDQTCVTTRVHASVKKILDARAKYDTANRNYLEAMGRYTKDSISHLKKPGAEDLPRLNGLKEDLARAEAQLDAKKKEKADAIASGNAKESYLNSLDELIRQTQQDADNIRESIKDLEQAGIERQQQVKEWQALSDLADQRVRTAESTAQKYSAHYEEIGEARLAKCIYLIDQNRLKRQAPEPGQETQHPER